MAETVEALEPNIGIKKKRAVKRTYLGEEPTLQIPALIPKEIKELKLKNQQKALEMLDDHIEEALQVLIDGLKSTTPKYDKDGNVIDEVPDKWFRYTCATTLIKKVLPDKKSFVGATPTEQKVLNYIDKRTEVFNIVNLLDELGFEDLRQRTQDGSFRLLEPVTTGERGKKTGVPGEESADSIGERSGSEESPGEGVESAVPSETGPGEG